jgi:hypothetical protein
MAGTAIASLSMQIAQEATGGDYFPGKLISQLLQKMGVDEKTANIAGMAVVGGLLLIGSAAGAIMSGGAGVAGTVANVAKMVKAIAAVTQAAVSIANGALAIDSALHQYESDMAGVSLKELQALLEKLKALSEMEEDFLRALMEEEKMLTEAVEKIVEGAADATQSIAGNIAAAPSMA